MEQPVRNQLEQILPRGIGVGSGFVIDSEGGTSRQTDVVLYEKDICPVFSVNNTPDTTYYPCEGVIAVGEIKSTLDKQRLGDAFKKIASVKRLRRHQVHGFMPHPTSGKPIIQYRYYGSLQKPAIPNMDEELGSSETSQIFGFVLSGSLRLRPQTFCEAFQEYTSQTGDSLAPNLAIILSGGVLSWGNITTRRFEKKWSDERRTYGMTEVTGHPPEWKPSWSAQTASLMEYSEGTDSFRTLIRWIQNIYQNGKTSDVQAFDRYFLRKDSPQIASGIFWPKR